MACHAVFIHLGFGPVALIKEGAAAVFGKPKRQPLKCVGRHPFGSAFNERYDLAQAHHATERF
jgi:hypothetical protein